MPKRLAVTKCPVSCSITETSRAARKISQPTASTFDVPPYRGSAPGSPGELPRPGPRPCVYAEDILERGRPGTRRVVLRDYASHGVNDPRERDTPREEVGHACLVGRVVDGGRGAAEPGRLAGQCHRGERGVVE